MTVDRKAAMSDRGIKVVRANKARKMEIGGAWDLFKPTRPSRKHSDPHKQRKKELKKQANELQKHHEENVAKMDCLVLKGRIVVETDKAGRRTYVEKVKKSGYADDVKSVIKTKEELERVLAEFDTLRSASGLRVHKDTGKVTLVCSRGWKKNVRQEDITSDFVLLKPSATFIGFDVAGTCTEMTRLNNRSMSNKVNQISNMWRARGQGIHLTSRVHITNSHNLSKNLGGAAGVKLLKTMSS